jgi:parvulin-like peptidyl-prolyl isomerase
MSPTHRLVTLGLILGLIPALAAAAPAGPANGPAPAPAAAPAPAKAAAAPATTPAVPAPAAGPASAYAALKSAPATPREDCRVTKMPDGELRAPLFVPPTAGCPVARVASDEVILEELADAMAESHMAKGSKASRGAKAKAIDFKPTLDRIVDVHLLVLEARDMGITDQPEYKQAVEGYRASALRTTLQQEAAADAKPDPAEVDKFFKAAVKQWKVRSIKFETEEDARKFRAEVVMGGSFEALAKAAVAEKKAQSGEPGFVTPKQLVPEMAKAAAPMQVGEVSQPVKLSTGWVVMKIEDVRYPEDTKAMEEARAASLGEQQHKAVRQFHESLVKKYATVDEKLLASLDFEAGGEAGFKELMKDQRPLALIRDEAPLTVAQLAAEINTKFFHGVADPIKEHRVNKEKMDTFELLLGARLFAREARERKLDQAPAFRRRVANFDRVLAFNTFIEKVLIPGIKVTDREAQALYEKRKNKYTSPTLYRLDGLAFGNAKAAQSALAKLQGGTDFAWLRANADGQLKPEERQLQFEGTLLSVNTLPESLVKALTGSKASDYRLYATDDGKQHYVVRVVDIVPPAVRPYPEVREELGREIEAEKIGAAVRDYAGKLRKVQKIDVIITRIAI